MGTIINPLDKGAEVKILYTRAFLEQFKTCLSLRPLWVSIVVPYIGDIPNIIGQTHSGPQGRKREIVDFAKYLQALPCGFSLVTTPLCDLGKNRVCQKYAKQLPTTVGNLITTPTPCRKANNRICKVDANKLTDMGVELRLCSDNLHSKIYQFTYRNEYRNKNAPKAERKPAEYRMGFVGSANFSIGGFQNNTETVAFFQSQADNAKIAREINRISGGGRVYNRNSDLYQKYRT